MHAFLSTRYMSEIDKDPGTAAEPGLRFLGSLEGESGDLIPIIEALRWDGGDDDDFDTEEEEEEEEEEEAVYPFGCAYPIPIPEFPPRCSSPKSPPFGLFLSAAFGLLRLWETPSSDVDFVTSNIPTWSQ